MPSEPAGPLYPAEKQTRSLKEMYENGHNGAIYKRPKLGTIQTPINTGMRTQTAVTHFSQGNERPATTRNEVQTAKQNQEHVLCGSVHAKRTSRQD